MNIFKRSILYIIRKKKRTLLLFTILLVVSTLILSGLSIMDATQDSSTELRGSTGAGFTMVRNLGTSKRSNSGNTFVFQQELITDEMIKKIAGTSGIKGYNAKKEGLPDLQDAGGNNLETIVYSNWYNSILSIWTSKHLACFDTSYDSFFTSNEFQLVEGRHIANDDNQVAIISSDLSKKHNLKVGDKVKLALTEEFVSAETQSGTRDISVNDVEVEIVGLFNILTEQSDKNTLPQSELYENYIFSDIKTFTDLFSAWPGAMQQFGEGYGEADFYVADPEQLGNIMADVADISSINWDNFVLIANDEVYQSSSSSMSNIDKLISTMIIIVAIIAIIVITFILSMWIRSRIREAGILMAAGISKFNIILQYILETILVALLAFSLSYFTSNAVAGSLGHIIDSTIAAKDITVVMDNFVLTCSVGMLVILTALIISNIPVMRMKPRELLSKMS